MTQEHDFFSTLETVEPSLVLVQNIRSPLIWIDKRGKEHRAHSGLTIEFAPSHVKYDAFSKNLSNQLSQGQYKPTLRALLQLVTQKQRDLLMLRVFGNAEPAVMKSSTIALAKMAVSSSLIWGNYRSKGVKQVLRTVLLNWLTEIGETVTPYEETGTIDANLKSERVKHASLTSK